MDNFSFYKLLSNIWKEEDAISFRYPVRYKELGLLDYPILIKNPIDLSTIRKNIKNNKYTNIKQLLEDVDLIWKNCKQYNVEGSDIYKQAEKMEKIVKKIVSNMMKTKVKKNLIGKQFQNDESSKDNKSDDLIEFEFEEKKFKEKLKICQIMKTLNLDQLTEIITIIQNNNINAIEICQDDKFFIKLEELTSGTITKIFSYFDEIKVNLNDN